MKRRKGSTRCKVCNHPERHHIDRLIAGQKYADRVIAVKFRLSMSSVRRHRIDHLPKYLAHSAKARELVDKEKILGEIEDMVHDVRMMFDACHEWLLDPEDPSRYFLGPRAHEIEVVYLERVVVDAAKGKERVFKHRARLDELLAKTGVEVDHSQFRIADPRRLILEASERLEHIIETIADISGFIPKPGYGGPQTQINMQVIYQLMPNVITALRAFPEAMAAVMAELEKAREAPAPLLEAPAADGS